MPMRGIDAEHIGRNVEPSGLLVAHSQATTQLLLKQSNQRIKAGALTKANRGMLRVMGCSCYLLSSLILSQIAYDQHEPLKNSKTLTKAIQPFRYIRTPTNVNR